MGQYYRPVLRQKGKTVVYSRDIDNQYTFAKLTEHSWWDNELMIAIGDKLYRRKGKLAWVGDYTEDEELKMLKKKRDYIWSIDGEGLKSISLKDFNYNNKYICNHDKKQYLDLNEYYNRSVTNDGWCLCPLSILTAIGNGRGGGDYSGDNMDKVGIWAWDTISIESEIPKGYVKQDIFFKEHYL